MLAPLVSGARLPIMAHDESMSRWLRPYVAAVAVLAALAAAALALVDAGEAIDEPWLLGTFAALIALEHRV